MHFIVSDCKQNPHPSFHTSILKFTWSSYEAWVINTFIILWSYSPLSAKFCSKLFCYDLSTGAEQENAVYRDFIFYS